MGVGTSPLAKITEEQASNLEQHLNEIFEDREFKAYLGLKHIDPFIEENKSEEKEVISEQTAWDMTRMLESVVEQGTGTAGFSQNSLAGKTGTTSFEGVSGGTRDAWFVGYNQEVVGAMWLGYINRTDE